MSQRMIITLESGVKVLVSYSTPVAAFLPGEGYIVSREYAHYSATTTRHINQWLGTSDYTVVNHERVASLIRFTNIQIG